MKRLYGTSDPAEAEALCSLLRKAGIEATFDPEGFGIHVSDQDAPRAAEVLAAHFEGKSVPEEPAPEGWLSRLVALLTGKKKGSAPR